MICKKHNRKMIQLFSSWKCDECDGLISKVLLPSDGAIFDAEFEEITQPYPMPSAPPAPGGPGTATTPPSSHCHLNTWYTDLFPLIKNKTTSGIYMPVNPTDYHAVQYDMSKGLYFLEFTLTQVQKRDFDYPHISDFETNRIYKSSDMHHRLTPSKYSSYISDVSRYLVAHPMSLMYFIMIEVVP